MVNRDGDFSQFYRVQRFNAQLIAVRLDTNWTPMKRCEVIIKNIPVDILLQDIFEFVRPFGPIYNIRILLEYSGYCRGICFVTFYNPELTKRAIFTLDRQQLRENIVSICLSVDNCFLELKNVPDVFSTVELLSVLPWTVKCGLKSIFQSRLPGKFVLEYATHYFAIQARRFVNPSFQLDGVHVEGDWMTPRPVRDSRLHIYLFDNK